MKIRVAVIGRTEPSFLTLEREYIQRTRAFPIELVEGKHAGDDAAARKKEAEVLLAACPKGATVVALDERSEQLDSVAFSIWLRTLQDRAVQQLVFLVGGASGLDASIRSRADRLLSLSAMTLPHRVARLILFEQLYRASSLLRGEPYHK